MEAFQVLFLPFLHIFQSIMHVKQISEMFDKTTEVFIGVYIFVQHTGA